MSCCDPNIIVVVEDDINIDVICENIVVEVSEVGIQGAPGKGLNFRGTFIPSNPTPYQIDDVVQFEGSAWVCIVADTVLSPDASPSSWSLLVSGAVAVGVPTFVQEDEPVYVGAYTWWDTSGGDLTLWIEDGL